MDISAIFGKSSPVSRPLASSTVAGVHGPKVWKEGTIFYRERIKEMVRLRKEGKTLEFIGSIYHLTRERVRQLMNREGIDYSEIQEGIDNNLRKSIEIEWYKGKTLRELCEEFKHSSAYLERFIPPRDDKWRYARFMRKVKINQENGCWIWTGCINKVTKYGHTHNESAHRVIWKLIYGNIPKGMQILHHCDNPPCVNPYHLFLGTAKDNMHDRDKKGRMRNGPNAPGIWKKAGSVPTVGG